MGRPKKPRPSLALFPGRPTPERAWQLVERYPIGSRFAKETIKSRGREYGPYWFVRFTSNGKTVRRYVGDEAKKQEIELAWEVVEAELAAAESSPEVRRLRELEMKAKAPGAPGKRLARTKGTVDVPIRGVVGPK
jgi:hypothetical protein